MTNAEKLNCLTDRPCTVCKYHKENGCSKWSCVFEQEPTTKNDLGVDCISRDVVKNYIQAHIHEIITESGEDKNKHTNRVLRSMIHGVNCMPSITPQEPILDKVRAQIKSNLRGVEIALEVLVENHPLRSKMEGAKDTLEECLELIDKAETEGQDGQTND